MNTSIRLVLGLLLATVPLIAGADKAAPCDLGGLWTRSDHVQTVELYRVESRWFGRLVSSSEKDATPGVVMFKDFTYDEQTRQFKGTVVVPTSGMQASAGLVCLDGGHFKVTAHKFFITKSYDFTRVESR